MKSPVIQKILVPVDFSKTSLVALEHAAKFAGIFKAEIFLLHVIELFEYTFNFYEPLVSIDAVEMETTIHKNLRQHADRIAQQYNVPVMPVVTRGRVSTEISDAALDNKVDLIIMGTHGAKGFSEFFVGTNAHRTVSMSSCPVISIQENSKAPGFQTIVMPIDETLHSRQKVDTVILIAKNYNATVHVLGLPHSSDKTDRAKFAIKIESVEKALKHAGVNYIKSEMEDRNLASAALDYASRVNADLIAIMTDHESDLTGRFLGGFAKQIINHSTIPILSIRPMEGEIETSFGGGGYD